MSTYLFFRRSDKGQLFFYPVEIDKKKYVELHVKINPGTVKVEYPLGNVVWPVIPIEIVKQ